MKRKTRAEYGTPVTLEELKVHYEMHFMTSDQFIELVEDLVNQKYSEKEVIKISKEAVGLWRGSHNARLYRSYQYFGKWIKTILNK